MQDICDDYGFHFLENVRNPVVKLHGIGKESRFSREYYWDNRKRTSQYLFQYTLNGSGTLLSEGKAHLLEKGEAFFIQMPGEEIYCFDEERNEAPWEFIYILFTGSCVEEYYSYITERFGRIMRLSEYHPAIRKLFDIYGKAQDGQLTNAFFAGIELFAFLNLLCMEDAEEKQCRIPLVEGTKAYLEQHYHKEEVTLLSVAESMGVSQSHLSREFAKYVGEPPVRYLTKLRLEKAAELLCATELGMEEVSRECGFGDVNYFGKVFRKYMKMAPGEFRRQAKVQGYKNIQV